MGKHSKIILSVFFALLFGIFAYPYLPHGKMYVYGAQFPTPIYDLPCPNGFSPLYQTTNPVNGHIKVWACVDALGNVGFPPLSNGNIFLAAAYGVKANTYAVFDAVCTNGSPIVTTNSGHFITQGKIRVGQIAWVMSGGGLAPASITINETTVLSINSDTQITLNANGNVNCGSSQALIWGDDDTVALNNLYAAVLASPDCGAVQVAGLMMVQGGVFNKAPNAATSACAQQLTNNAISFSGPGWQTATFVPRPTFDLSTCAGTGISSCFFVPGMQVSNIQVNGFGLTTALNLGTVTNVFSIVTPSMFTAVSCQAWLYTDTNLSINVGVGLNYSSNSQYVQCGGNGPVFNSSAVGPWVGNYYVPGNGTSPTVNSTTPGTDFYTNWFSASGVNECSSIISGFAHFFGLPSAPGAEQCVNGGTATYNGSVLSHNQGIAGRAALKITSGGKVYAANSSFTDAGAGEFSVSVDATSQFTDGCGNTFVGNINVAAGGIFIPCPGTVYPSDPSHPTTTGSTGACATITTQTGNIFTGNLRCTGTTGASTIVLIPGITAKNGYRCSASDLTTNADLLNQSGSSTTSCTLSAASITANDTITFQVSNF